VFYECVYGKRSTHHDDDVMSASLAELDIVIGCAANERKWIPDSSQGWASSFLLSGMNVGSQRRAWRFTPSLPLQINCISKNIPDNVTRWDPHTLVSYKNDSLVLGPLQIDHDGRILNDCQVFFKHGAVLDVFASAAYETSDLKLPPGVPTTTASPFGIWIVQPIAAASPTVSCMAGGWHGMKPFEGNWPLEG
jgi:hypothetical protein